MNFKCKICNNSNKNEEFIVREMMYGTREKFTYFKCSYCGCLQISAPPKEISEYYPRESYYSYQEVEYKDNWCSRIKNKVKLILFSIYFYIYMNTKHTFFMRKLPFLKTLDELEWLKMLIRQRAIKRKYAVLDVGCGVGQLLQIMNIWGFKNLTGVDPFIEKDITYPSGIKVHKQNIFSITGMYDLIMLHHSFEHMDNPHQVLKQLCNMLNVDGHLLIRIPISVLLHGVNMGLIGIR